MNTLKTTFILIIGLSLIFSCKNDDETPTQEDLLTGKSSKSWKITALSASSDDPAYKFITIDIYNNTIATPLGNEPTSKHDIPQYPECAKDDIVIFNSDKTYEINEGDSSCTNGYLFQLTGGHWSLSSDKKTLILTQSSGIELKYDIKSLTESSMSGETPGSFPYEGTNIEFVISTTFTAVK